MHRGGDDTNQKRNTTMEKKKQFYISTGRPRDCEVAAALKQWSVENPHHQVDVIERSEFALECESEQKQELARQIDASAVVVIVVGGNEELQRNEYLRHEFEQAKQCKKTILVFYDSHHKKAEWLPHYMKNYDMIARPFWISDAGEEKVGDYAYIEQVLRYV
jgi:hypothetical protein